MLLLQRWILELGPPSVAFQRKKPLGSSSSPFPWGWEYEEKVRASPSAADGITLALVINAGRGVESVDVAAIVIIVLKGDI